MREYSRLPIKGMLGLSKVQEVPWIDRQHCNILPINYAVRLELAGYRNTLFLDRGNPEHFTSTLAL